MKNVTIANYFQEDYNYPNNPIFEFADYHIPNVR
jgi:hypothetical protein